jgi:hypothetical protein
MRSTLVPSGLTPIGRVIPPRIVAGYYGFRPYLPVANAGFWRCAKWRS